MDSVFYQSSFPWPVEADGLGPTLELISPDLDNLLADSWHASPGVGTPGAMNHYISATGRESHTDPLRVYPNPVREQLNMVTGRPGLYVISVMIYDLQGRIYIVKSTSAGEEISTLDVSSLPAGQYLLLAVMSGGDPIRVMIRKL
jgi:hypothetical protein